MPQTTGSERKILKAFRLEHDLCLALAERAEAEDTGQVVILRRALRTELGLPEPQPERDAFDRRVQELINAGRSETFARLKAKQELDAERTT